MIAPKKLQTKLFINGEFVDSTSGKTFATVNPATGEEIAQVAAAEKADACNFCGLAIIITLVFHTHRLTRL